MQPDTKGPPSRTVQGNGKSRCDSLLDPPRRDELVHDPLKTSLEEADLV